MCVGGLCIARMEGVGWKWVYWSGLRENAHRRWSGTNGECPHVLSKLIFQFWIFATTPFHFLKNHYLVLRTLQLTNFPLFSIFNMYTNIIYLCRFSVFFVFVFFFTALSCYPGFKFGQRSRKSHFNICKGCDWSLRFQDQWAVQTHQNEECWRILVLWQVGWC